jgi:hypothetical protein
MPRAIIAAYPDRAYGDPAHRVIPPGGLVTVVGNVRKADVNQRALAQSQDFPDSVVWTPASSLLQNDNWEAGQAILGTPGVAGSADTLSVRFRTALNDGVLLCDGSTNTAQGPAHAFTNTSSVQPAAPTATPPLLGGLYCQVDNLGASAVAPAGVLIVPGVVGMKVYYGVKRDFAFADYNVDTYLTANQMCSPLLNPCGGDDWSNVSSVRVILTFTNPLAAQPGQPPTIQFERVIEVMARGAVHT